MLSCKEMTQLHVKHPAPTLNTVPAERIGRLRDPDEILLAATSTTYLHLQNGRRAKRPFACQFLIAVQGQ